MQDTLQRAQHYYDLSDQMKKTAKAEPDPVRQNELLGLGEQYARLAMKLMAEHVHGADQGLRADQGQAQLRQ